ncbi:amino acid adenylation domain-containing protein [Fulvivirga maritima]|uniref:non-ribosomal peptide synthetase n=1 Tax=Fulvivirga maritima TaxID=2904247 RepID=UPI001F304ECB|nr:non-ribosomal peptide synthetase [Fulvivirga maritima]UII29505.1 amino acid adenylation domain-containing protein [Fulvivirga maritima]
MKAGSAFLPLDSNQNLNRQKVILRESGCNVLLTKPELQSDLQFNGEKLYLSREKNSEFAANRVGGTVYVIYTSGSTGKPKGVKINDKNLLNYVHWAKRFLELNTEDKSILTSSYAFDLGYTSIFPILLSGGELHLVDKETYQSPEKLLEYIEINKISYLKMTPSLFSTLISPLHNFSNALTSVKHVLLGGEPIRIDDVLKVKDKFDHIHFVNHYGPTETTIGVIAERIDDFERFAQNPVIGRPIDNIQIYIVGENHELLPVGVTGEICIAGSGVGEGYLNSPHLTFERFINSSLSDGNVYRTGDKARWLPDGKIQFLGRVDDQVKIRGYRVELGEVKKHLLLNPDVLDAAVVVKGDDSQKMIVAYYVSHSEIESDQLKNYMSASLPDYMVPGYYIELQVLPLTGNGKLDKRQLPDPNEDKADLVGTKNERQELLLALWSEILGKSVNQIGIHSDFFDLGGNSINAIKLNYMIKQQFEVELNMRQIFDFPTISQLSELIDKAKKSKSEDIGLIGQKEHYTASSAQERLYLEHFRDVNDLTYNIATAYKVVGEIDVDKFSNVFQKLVDRHENLRTSFSQTDDGDIVQKIHEGVVFELQIIDGTVADSIEEAMEAFVRPFDLGDKSLMRVALFKHSDLGNYLLLDIHHIICDGISKNILMSDFKRFYKGETLPSIPIRYVDYAHWQKIQNSLLDKQKKFWIDKLEDLPAHLDMPRLKELDPHVNKTSSFEASSLSGELYSKIKRLSASENTSDFMFLLAAFYIMLSKITGQKDLVIGTDVAGRTHSSLKNVVGTFVNLLPLRMMVEDEMKIVDFMQKVKECVLEAYDNQDFQYDQMISFLNENSSMLSQLFHVHFALVNYHDESVKFDVLKFEPIDVKWAESSPFEFKIHVIDEKDRFLVHFIYNTEYYDKDTIQLLIRYYNHIITTVIDDSNITIGGLEMQNALNYA